MSGVDGAGRSANANPATGAEQAKAVAQRVGAPIPAGKPGAAGSVAMPTVDGMGESPVLAPQTASVPKSGLNAGEAGNPFQALGSLLNGQVNAQQLKLVEGGIGLDVEVLPGDEAAGKLAGLDKKAVYKDGRFVVSQERIFASTDKVREGHLLLLSDALPADDSAPLSNARAVFAGQLARDFASERAWASMKNTMFAQRSSFPMGMDVMSFVQAVLRESYMLQNEELLDRGRKMKELNDYKRSLTAKKIKAEKLQLKLLSGDATEDEFELLAELLGFEIVEDALEQEGWQADDVPPGETNANEAGQTQKPNGASDNAGESSDFLGLRAVSFLGGVEFDPPAHPDPRLGAFANSLQGDRWKTSDFLVRWLKSNPSDVESALVHAAMLPPHEYRYLVRGLIRGLIRGSEGQKPFEDEDYRLSAALRLVFASGTPDQFAELQGHLDTEEWRTLESALDGHEYDTSRGVLGARDYSSHRVAKASKNEFEAGTDARLLFDHYLGRPAVPGTSDIDELRYMLSSAEPAEAAAFLEAVAEDVLQRRNGRETLAALFSALPSGHLEGDNLAHFGWLDEALINANTGTILHGSTEVERDPSAANRYAEGSSAAKQRMQSLGVAQSSERFTGVTSGLSHDPTEDVPTENNAAAPGAEAGRVEEGVSSNPYMQGESEEVPEFKTSWSREEKEEFLRLQLADLDSEIETAGFDAQMMQLELQNLMQKQQQFLTMMSNISKMMHDVAMSIIRNIGG
ncbi:MAG: hypothetical protein AAF658_00975 [Myxococcota bacterium]